MVFYLDEIGKYCEWKVLNIFPMLIGWYQMCMI